jgi:glycosyltransferase involved in cell wall biosynthesis
MATGLPVITTEHTAGLDIITDGKDGFLVPIRDVFSLTDKLELLYNNPDLNISMGIQAHATASKYTWKNFRKNIVKIVEGLDEV